MAVKSIAREFLSLEDKLKELSPLSPNCCIYRVPTRLRQMNEKAYTPQVVSIGPLHHGRDDLQFMEEHKQRYLLDFLRRTGISFKQAVEIVRNKEKDIRDCYAEAIKFSSEKFVEIILVDASFIIEVLLRSSNQHPQNEHDRIFKQPFLIQDIWYDIWLLENQLPFFILEELFKQARESILSKSAEVSHSNSILFEQQTMIKLTCKYFNKIEAVNNKIEKFSGSPTTTVKHFTDFIRICYLPWMPPSQKIIKVTAESSEQLSPEKNKVTAAPSVVQLHQAGVKFKLSSSKESFDISFRDGTLEIPKLRLSFSTESLFRNLIAFEQCHYFDNYINDYVFVVRHLVNTPKDVELLVRKGIIKNWLPDTEEASTLINNLSRGTTLDAENFYFSCLCEELKEYCEKRYHRWRATLKQNYFSTPWASISVIAAILLLVLTVIQSICSVVQVVPQLKNCS